jgi:endonuclease G
MATSANPLCFTAYAVIDSGILCTPLWAAEHLTSLSWTAATHSNGKTHFLPNCLPKNTRRAAGLLQDYARLELDLRQMVPSGDMPTAKTRCESLPYLKNILS